jgi:predicted lipoprotein with Yx(FWY)xxD motif
LRTKNYKTLLGALFVLALIVTACAPAPAETPSTSVPTEVSTVEPTDAATEAPAATDTASVATDTATVDETATVSVPVTGDATVNVSESADFGSILVDGEGMSLYLFTNDTQNSGTSTCTGECLVEWPALTTEGDPVAGEGVDATLLGTITRDDGSTQVTYNGWPLYYFHEDAAAGDTNGQGLGGVWFLVSPEGEAIEQ